MLVQSGGGLGAMPIGGDPEQVRPLLLQQLGRFARTSKIAISTDAHSATKLDLMRFGVDQARRGWL